MLCYDLQKYLSNKYMSHKFLNINWDDAENKTTKIKAIRTLKYYVPPPFINSTITYQNVNADPQLREQVTNFFLKKAIKWVSTYKEFNNDTKLLNKLKSDSGYDIIYKLLKNYINKKNLNWYDLRKTYNAVKDYLRYKLANI